MIETKNGGNYNTHIPDRNIDLLMLLNAACQYHESLLNAWTVPDNCFVSIPFVVYNSLLFY